MRAVLMGGLSQTAVLARARSTDRTGAVLAMTEATRTSVHFVKGSTWLLTARDKKSLAELFGERVTFDKTERKLYGHDIAAMPSMVKPVIGNTVPDAVVQPRSAEQLARLMQWANDKRHRCHAARQGDQRLRRRDPGQERPRRRLLLHEGCRRCGRGRADRHRPGRDQLGAARPRAGAARADPAPVPVELPELDGRRLARPGRRRLRQLRLRLLRRQRRVGDGGAAERREPHVRRRRPGAASPARRASRASSPR